MKIIHASFEGRKKRYYLISTAFLRAQMPNTSQFKGSQAISLGCDNLVRQLQLFSEKQRELMNIIPDGLQRTILLRS